VRAWEPHLGALDVDKDGLVGLLDTPRIGNGVSIIGNSSLQSTMPSDASKMYGKNVLNFLQLIITKEGEVNLNWEDDLVKGSCVTHNGEIVHERLK